MKNLSSFPKVIKTSRLVLRYIDTTIENAKILFDIIEQNRDYLEMWQGHFGALRTVDDVFQKLERRNTKTVKNEGVQFGIYKDDKLIGRIRFFNADDKSCEIGYWLIKSENGNGYMTEALVALEQELFKFGFEKIILEIDDGNIPSANVAKRNGYKLEKKLPMESYAKCVGKCDALVYVKKI